MKHVFWFGAVLVTTVMGLSHVVHAEEDSVPVIWETDFQCFGPELTLDFQTLQNVRVSFHVHVTENAEGHLGFPFDVDGALLGTHAFLESQQDGMRITSFPLWGYYPRYGQFTATLEVIEVEASNGMFASLATPRGTFHFVCKPALQIRD